MGASKNRKLGPTDIEISPIGLGCWQFSGGKGLAGKFWPALTAEDTEAIVRVSLEGGINWFDTAEMYGHGQSEWNLAKALKVNGKSNGDVVVATKWFPFFRRAKSILSTIDTRIKFLDGFSIDLHQIHTGRGSLSSYSKQMNAMADLVDQGKIKSVGISNFSAKQMRACWKALKERNIPLATNQMSYSLLRRKIESDGVMDTAKELGITIIAYSPLAQGVLGGKYHADNSLIEKLSRFRRRRPAFTPEGLEKSTPLIQELNKLAQEYDASPSEVALNWLVHFHGESVVAIPGATKISQAEQNVGAMKFVLTGDELGALDEVSKPYL